MVELSSHLRHNITIDKQGRIGLIVLLLTDIFLMILQIIYNNYTSENWYVDTILAISLAIVIYGGSILFLRVFSSNSDVPPIQLLYSFPDSIYYFFIFLSIFLTIPLSAKYSLLIIVGIFISITFFQFNLFFVSKEKDISLYSSKSAIQIIYKNKIFLFNHSIEHISTSPYRFLVTKLIQTKQDIFSNKLVLESITLENIDNSDHTNTYYLYLVSNEIDRYNNAFAFQIAKTDSKKLIISTLETLNITETSQIHPSTHLIENGSGIVLF